MRKAFGSLVFAPLLGWSSLAGVSLGQSSSVPSQSSPTLTTEAFQLREDVLAGLDKEVGHPSSEESQAGTGPFGSGSSPPPKVRRSHQAILERAGIAFPPGAAMSFSPATGVLTLRNTPENLALTKALILGRERSLPRGILAMAYCFEIPPALSRSAHPPALEELLESARQPGSGVRLRAIAGGQCSAGEDLELSSSRAQSQSRAPSGREGRWEADAESHRAGLKLGLKTELDSRMGRVALTYDLSLTPDDPVPAASHEASGTIQLLDGQSQLVGWWPSGEGRSTAVFLRAWLVVPHGWPNRRTAEPVPASFPQLPETMQDEIFLLPSEPFPLAATEEKWRKALEFEGLPLPEGTRFAREDEGRRWKVRSTPGALDGLRRFVEERWSPQAWETTATVEIIRGPASIFLPQTESPAREEDVLLHAQASVDRGEAARESILHLHALAGHDAWLSSGISRQRPVSALWSPEGGEITFRPVLDGIAARTKSEILPDGRLVKLSLRLARSTPARERPRLRSPDGALDLPGDARAETEFRSRLVLADGESRLLGLWSLPGSPAGTVEAAILTARAVRRESPASPLRYAGEEPLVDPGKKETRVFRGCEALLPHAIPVPGDPSKLSLVALLEKSGIAFGKDDHALYDPAAASLTVRNTAGRMELVESFLRGGPLGPAEPDFRLATLHVYEAAAPLVRALLDAETEQPDGHAVLSMLRKAGADGEARETDVARVTGLETQRLETRTKRTLPRPKRLLMNPAKDQPEIETEDATSSSVFQVDLGFQEKDRISFEAFREQSSLQPVPRMETFTLPGQSHPAKMALPDLPTFEFQSSACPLDNGSCILAVWPSPAPGLLRIAILESRRMRKDADSMIEP